MLIKKVKYSYNDVMIVPSVLSSIEHRSECKPSYEDGYLPIFTAPMSTVVNEDNFDIFEENHIHAILPRNIDFETRIKYSLNNKWAAFSLEEFKNFFCDETLSKNYINIKKKALIDVANGHMKKLYSIAKKAKRIYGDSLELMVGNIANPETYLEAYKANVDYIRISIGTGAGCITSSNVSIHYGIASLIDEIKELRNSFANEHCINIESMTKIVADGGIRNYSDVIKALALGADYVMIGGLLSQTVESAAKSFIKDENNNIIDFNPTKDKILSNNKFIVNENEYNGVLYKIFYGMASKEGQIDLNGCKDKTSEGIKKLLPCSYTLSKWVDNMESYLKSAMSYTNTNNINDFKRNVDLILISDKTFVSINK